MPPFFYLLRGIVRFKCERRESVDSGQAWLSPGAPPRRLFSGLLLEKTAIFASVAISGFWPSRGFIRHCLRC